MLYFNILHAFLRNSASPTKWLRFGVRCQGIAGVVLLDLRPANVMWRVNVNDDEFSLKLIDFEDVYLAGWTITNETFQSHLKDPRYNHKLYEKTSVSGVYSVHTITNDFSLKRIEGYLRYCERKNLQQKDFGYSKYCKSVPC